MVKFGRYLQYLIKVVIWVTPQPPSRTFLSTPDNDDEMYGEDLFPKDFIVSLDPPENYVGPKRVFIDSPTKFIRYIEDNEEIIPIKHRISLRIVELPLSLKTAIRTFILVGRYTPSSGSTERA